MRALVVTSLGPPESHAIIEVDDPVPGRGELVVDVAAAALNFPDVLIMAGKYQVKPSLPFVPGAEGSGVVAAVGDGVGSVTEGDRVMFVTTIGAFAEKALVPESQVIKIPSEVGFEAAAGISMAYGTSYYALKQRSRLQPGETLLVLGAAGGVGSTAVELGKAMGATVIAAASSEEKRLHAGALGADHTINYSGEDLRERIKDITGGRGVDVVFDPVGGELSEPALRSTGWDGRFLVIGFAAGDIPSIPLNLALLKGLSIVGVFWGSWVARDPEGSAANYRELFEMVAAGTISPRATDVYPFERYVDAFSLITNRQARGKVVLTF